MVNIAHFIPVFPFVAFWLNIIFGCRLGVACAYVSVGASAISAVLAVLVFMGLQAGGGSYVLTPWLSVNGHPISLGIIVDSLTVMMLLVVTIVGTLIQIYSIGYMGGDPRFTRYFAYISLFMSSMLGLVLVDNLFLLYIFWEGVGLCSCLLVAFWYEKPAAAAAGIKAFITTRVGDTGLLLGILLLMSVGHSLRFADMSVISAPEPLMVLAALLIFMGAVGKSAQFPLHVWLPDAMEGPTAVSALIHAATMVAAGVYLVARCYPLFTAHPLALQTVAVIGAISAVMAASIACFANDIKKVLAYSTISQLGLMMLGLGAGGYTGGTFHLMTHAFFKALLFLGAGSVIHAVHTQDIRAMGGLFNKMKVTSVTFIIGALALAGVAPLSGFWSKDEILTAVWQHGNLGLFIAAVTTSFLTAFYMTRLILLAFFGESRGAHKAHESPAVMTMPLVILAFFALFLGFAGSPWAHHAFQRFIAPEEGEVALDLGMAVASTVIACAGILTAFLLRGKFLGYKEGTCALIENKYYFDEIYDALFVKPFHRLAAAVARFDQVRVDGVVNGVSRCVQELAQASRSLQTGLVENYLLAQAGGVFVLIVVVTLVGKLCHIF